jgi:hypothetical protein
MALALLLLFGQFGSELFQESPTTEGDAAVQEQVERLLEQQIDINRASARELLAIPWLNPFLAYRIVATRDSVGRFTGVEQLRRVPGMTVETYEALRPFLRTSRSRRAWTGSVATRTATDSLKAGTAVAKLFNRLELGSGRAQGVALTEKDPGESNALDFLSAGVESRLGRTRFVLGDFTAGCGQGMVISAPQWRSSLLDATDRGSRDVRLVRSAVEGSYLRGGALEVAAGRWNVCMLGSCAGRDARLNGDGSVNRLVRSGVHDDSASLAGRNAVLEATAGLTTRYRGNRAGAGFVAEYSKYSRAFAPSDSSSSFAGDELLVAGVSAECRLGNYELGTEAAASGGTGLAGALQLQGDWQDFDSRVAIRGRQARFFAPHGRWSSLTGTKNRLDASGRLGWHHAGASVALSGNTYRDFELDSVPARLVVRLRQGLGRLELGLALGVRYQAERERHRTARAEVGGRIGRTTAARLILADVYPEKSLSRGTMAAVLLNQGLGPAELGTAAARIDVSGTGVSMYLHEPGAGRIGSSYNTGVSCWRVSAGCGVRFGHWLRLGLKTGCAWKPQAVLDGAAQLELASQQSIVHGP